MPTEDVFAFNRALVNATHDLVCAYKPNFAFYEALGLPGLRALEQTIGHIRDEAPQVLLIADAKRGDIGNTAAAYARALFDVWGFDAATVNPYLGGDAVSPFLDYRDKGTFVLCRTSNPGAGDFQDLVVSDNASGGGPLFQQVALRALEWDRYGNLGLVVGATYPRELEEVRTLCPNMPFLVPGIGSQGGDLEQSVRYGTTASGRRAIVNSSRGIIYASRGPDFAEAARSATEQLRDGINGVLDSEGRGW
jgi:orotidine-5'-phosphate decarboxylase